MGPGFLISIAYIDPGNFATDIQAGAQFNFRFIWVLVFATTLGLFLQVLSARLGMVTGKHLATVCREEYGPKSFITISVWLITESAIIASDIPEIIGTAFALNMLFGLPLWAGVLITAIDTMLFLAVQYFGVRYLELFIAALVGVISMCFITELGMSPIHWTTTDCPTTSEDWCSRFPANECPPNYCGTFFGGFIPRISSDGIYVAISLIGAVVMPHNLYLHSALVLSRHVQRTRAALKEANFYNWIECTLALALSCFVNISILTVAAANFYPDADNNFTLDRRNPDLDDTSHLLGTILGNAAQTVFAIALLAAGQSSTLTGTYAGQFVMEGFIQINMALWKRNLITRSIAILPSLLVAIVAGRQGSTFLIILSSAILAFQLPFALVPLLKFTSSKKKMGHFVNSKIVTIVMGILGTVVCAANCYLIVELFFGSESGFVWLISNTAGRVFASIALGIVGLGYFSLLGYLIYRPITVEERSYVDDAEQRILDESIESSTDLE
eukprot:TRINITY_DN4394_c0_g1_i1.p1 TRINITY_DN4394_c0_g1~~TRINITY_DN4394_c0_g1_i1.p1  ORF type:complete len:565 (-),score=117.90 TRINITY_DN4394_c0_g1_i1:40-1542(-)